MNDPTSPSPESPSLEVSDVIGAKDATHPRVALADIKAAIDSTYFVNARDAVSSRDAHPSLRLFTLAIVVMKNGFVVIGKSAPASPENFDKEKGELFAYEDAIRQLWPLMGYALREKLHQY